MVTYSEILTIKVNTSKKGFFKRNEDMLAVTRNTTHQLEFIFNFSEWLTNWNENSRKSLTRPTYQAAKQTSTVLVEVAK